MLFSKILFSKMHAVKVSFVAIVIALCILLIHIWRPRGYMIMLYRVFPRRYYTLRDFPEMSSLTASFEVIRKECLAVMAAPVHDVPRSLSVWTNGDQQITNDYIARTQNLYGWQPIYDFDGTINNSWINFPFMLRNAVKQNYYPENLKSCPHLAKLLMEKKDIIQVAGFSRIRAGKRIAQHVDNTGMKFNSAAYHLGLIVPDPLLCSMTVGGVKIYHREGQALIFEPTYLHHASNWSHSDRVILYIDFLI